MKPAFISPLDELRIITPTTREEHELFYHLGWGPAGNDSHPSASVGEILDAVTEVCVTTGTNTDPEINKAHEMRWWLCNMAEAFYAIGRISN
jgi:hypothetical protein